MTFEAEFDAALVAAAGRVRLETVPGSRRPGTLEEIWHTFVSPMAATSP